MTKQLKAGDRVSWKSHGGTAEGKVVKKLSSPTQIKVAASKDNRRDGQGETAAHKAEALTKV